MGANTLASFTSFDRERERRREERLDRDDERLDRDDERLDLDDERLERDEERFFSRFFRSRRSERDRR